MQSLRSFIGISLLAIGALSAYGAVKAAPAPVSTTPILEIHAAALTTFLPSAATSVQDIRPRAEQRGVNLDGSLRARSHQGMRVAGNPFERAWRAADVNDVQLGLGTYSPDEIDIALPAEGFSWVIGRTYNPRQETSGSAHRDSDGYQGKNWFQSSQPEIVLYEHATDDEEDVLYVVYGADRFVEYKRVDIGGGTSDTFKGTNGAAGVVLFEEGVTDEPDTYTLLDQHGYEYWFFGFDGDAGNAAGQIWKIVDPAGNTAYVGDDTTGSDAIANGFTAAGFIETAYDSSDRRYTYTHKSVDGTDRLSEVEVETKTGGTWGGTPTGLETVAKVVYDYYTDESYGDSGDLQLVEITIPMTDSGVEVVKKKYYRYWEGSFDSGSNPGHVHAVKYVVDFEGTRQQDWADQDFDDDFLVLSNASLEPYASAYFEYDSSHRVDEAWFNGDCGCGGGNNGTHLFEYETNGSFSDTAGAYDEEWKTRTVVERPDGSYLTQQFDEGLQGLDRLITDDDPDNTGPTPDRWLTHVIRDSSGLVTDIYTPATVTGYTHSTGLGTYSTSAGLVRKFTRVGSGAMTGMVSATKWAEGTSGTAYYDDEWEYEQQEITSFSGTTLDEALVRPLHDQHHVYHVESTSTGDRITTDFTPSVHSGKVMLNANQQDNPDLDLGARAPASGTVKEVYYRADGTKSFEEAEDDIVTYWEYTDGRLTKLIQDADTSQTGSGEDFENVTIPGGISSAGSPVHRVTTYAYDAQGRLDQTNHPDGRVTKYYYSKLADNRQVTLTYSDYETSPSTKYFGPVNYTVSDHGGNTVVQTLVGLTNDESTTALTSHVDETDDDPITAMDLAGLVRLTTRHYTETGGKLEESRLYFDIPASGAGTDGTNYDPTFFGYDASGRKTRVKQASGTISRTEYDILGRTSSSWIGTNDSTFDGGEPSGTDNMVKTEALVYDGGADDGNGYLTQRTLYVEDSTTDQRQTNYTNDVRGNLLLEERPESPHYFHRYDNKGRRDATATYSSVGSISAGSDDPTTEATNRLSLSRTYFDSEGRVEKTTRHKIDLDDGSDDDSLTTEYVRDEAGRTIRVEGAQITKTIYDRLGRPTHSFTLAEHNDTTYAHASDVAGDTVLEEYQTVYESNDSDDVLMRVTISRFENDATTGALDSNADGDDLEVTAANLSGRPRVTAFWYDRFGRETDSVRFGTNGGSDFDRDGLSVPARSDTALRTSTDYSSAGSVQDVTDPMDIVMRREYDAAGRQTKVIRNYDASVNSGNPSGTDDNQTVVYGYTDSLRTTITLDLPSGQTDQVTTYTYGTTKGASAGDSEISSGHLLREVEYPDSVSASDVVSYAYNAQSELIWVEDQAGNIIEYNHDDSGREAHRRVTTLDGDFDGAVRRISRTYTGSGRTELVTQYDNAAVGSGSVVDEVKFTYDDWGNVETYEQDRNSAVGAGGSVDDYEVSYTYEKATSGRRTVRRTGMTLPSGNVITYNYTLDVDDEASRVSNVVDGALTLATYEYLGVGHVVGTTYPEPGVFNAKYGSTAGTYPDLDRFNRVLATRWTRDLATDIDLYDTDYTYDRNGNPVLSEDNIHPGFDVDYTIDDLDRVVDAEEGTWNGSSITSKTREQAWTLDHAGNWDLVTLDLTGDGDFLDADEYEDSRTHNEVNELTARDVDNDSSDDYTMTYDESGALTDDGEDYEYVWDALGRLRKILDRSDDSIVAEYVYNGLGQMISIHEDTDDDGDVDGSDKWFHYAYGERWRQVATFREDDSDPKEEFVPQQAGADGGGRSSYVNGVVVRYKDADTAWTSASDGTLEERMYYCQNHRGDVVSIVYHGPLLVEWVHYSSYGIPYGLPGGDAQSDGDADVADGLQVAAWINGSTYDVRGDLDIDGDLDQDDLDYFGLYFLGESLGWEELSWVGNRLGYSGNVLLGSGYVSRRRHLEPARGAWMSRDSSYVDGISLYQYVRSQPLKYVDPMGSYSCPPETTCYPTQDPGIDIPVGDPGSAGIDRDDLEPEDQVGGGHGGPAPCDRYWNETAMELEPQPQGATFCLGGEPHSCNYVQNKAGYGELDSFSQWAISYCADIHESNHASSMDCTGVADYSSPDESKSDVEYYGYNAEFEDCWRSLLSKYYRDPSHPLNHWFCDNWCPYATNYTNIGDCSTYCTPPIANNGIDMLHGFGGVGKIPPSAVLTIPWP